MKLHAARHTFATLALEAGRSIRFVAEQLGHANPFVDGEDQLASLQKGRERPPSGTPNYDRPVGGMLPDGSSFSASTQIACQRTGTGAAQCDAGVVREGSGKGFVMVFWPDGGARVLYFEKGRISGYDESEADGGAKLAVTRRSDVQIVSIGDARFEVFDALLTGG